MILMGFITFFILNRLLQRLELDHRQYNDESKERKASYQVISMFTKNFQGYVDTAKDSKFSQVTGKHQFQINKALVMNNSSLKRRQTRDLTYTVQNVNTNPKSQLKRSLGSISQKDRKSVFLLADIGEEQEPFEQDSQDSEAHPWQQAQQNLNDEVDQTTMRIVHTESTDDFGEISTVKKGFLTTSVLGFQVFNKINYKRVSDIRTSDG